MHTPCIHKYIGKKNIYSHRRIDGKFMYRGVRCTYIQTYVYYIKNTQSIAKHFVDAYNVRMCVYV